MLRAGTLQILLLRSALEADLVSGQDDLALLFGCGVNRREVVVR